MNTPCGGINRLLGLRKYLSNCYPLLNIKSILAAMGSQLLPEYSCYADSAGG